MCTRQQREEDAACEKNFEFLKQCLPRKVDVFLIFRKKTKKHIWISPFVVRQENERAFLFNISHLISQVICLQFSKKKSAIKLKFDSSAVFNMFYKIDKKINGFSSTEHINYITI